MKLHNPKIQLEFNSIIAGLTVARDEIIDTLTSYDCPNSRVDPLKEDLKIVDEAIEQVREWAIRLDCAIPSSNF